MDVEWIQYIEVSIPFQFFNTDKNLNCKPVLPWKAFEEDKSLYHVALNFHLSRILKSKLNYPYTTGRQRYEHAGLARYTR